MSSSLTPHLTNAFTIWRMALASHLLQTPPPTLVSSPSMLSVLRKTTRRSGSRACKSSRDHSNSSLPRYLANLSLNTQRLMTWDPPHIHWAKQWGRRATDTVTLDAKYCRVGMDQVVCVSSLKIKWVNAGCPWLRRQTRQVGGFCERTLSKVWFHTRCQLTARGKGLLLDVKRTGSPL